MTTSPWASPKRMRASGGVHTITLDGGRLTDNLTTPSDPDGQPCEGTYRLSGHTFVFKWKLDTPCSGDLTGTWRLSDGELRFTNIRSDERFEKVYWGVRPFRKLG